MARLDIQIDPRGAEIGSAKAKHSIDGVKKSATGASSAMSVFNKSLLITSAATVAIASLTSLSSASDTFRDSLAEVSTLLDDVPGQMAILSDEAKRQAIEFGSMPTAQAQAFYQIISAGASDAAEATEILTSANKLAVGGVTDVTTAADGLTSVLNVYKDKVGGASDVTDILFVGMKAGKTTIGELASGVGKVIPLAEKVDVSFQEVVATIAALTKGGVSTQESVTGLRAILAAIIKPTSEAVAEAKDLRLEFNATALATKGLAGFLADLEEKTGGNTDSIAKLFGGVEALVPLLALTGSGATNLADVLASMETRLGATDTAFKKIAESPGFASRQFKALATVIAIELGDSISDILLPATRFIIENFDEISSAAGVVVVSLTAAFGPQIAAMIGVAFAGAVTTASTAVTFLTAAIAANPLGAIAVAITASVSALIFFGDKISVTSDGLVNLQDVASVVWNGITSTLRSAVGWWVDLFLDAGTFIGNAIFGWSTPVDITMTDIIGATKRGANIIIGVFVALVQTVEENWRLLPIAIGSVMVKTVNVVISATEILINRVVNAAADFLENISTNTIKGINFLLTQANKIPLLDFQLLIEPEFKENDFTFAFSRVEDLAEGSVTKIADNVKSIWEDALSTDFLRDFATNFETLIRRTAEARAKEVKVPGKPKAAGGVTAPGGTETLADLTVDQIATIQAAMDDFIAGANRDFETSFAGGYATQLASMVEATRTASFAMGVAFAEVFGPGGSLQEGLADSAARAIVFGDDLGQSITNLSKRVAVDLIAKFIETQLAMATVGTAAEVMSATTSSAIIAGNAATTASAIAGQQATAAGAVASNQAITASAVPAAAATSIATGGGSAITGQAAFTAAMVAMLAFVARANGLVEFAAGGVFTNSVVDKPTAFPMGVMGEAGPEAILPLSRNSSGQLGVVAAMGGGSSGAGVFAPVVSVNINTVQGTDAGVGTEISNQVKRQLDAAFTEFQRKSMRPGGQLNRQSVV